MGPFALVQTARVAGKDACPKHRKRCVKHAFCYLPGGAPRGVRGFMSGAYSLTPGPLPLVNSTPAFSSAFRIAAKVSGQPTSQLPSLLPRK